MPIPSAQPSLPLPLRRRRWLGSQSLTLMLVGAGALHMAPVGAQEPKRPAPVEIGEAERASQPDVAPVKVGEAGAAQGESETAPVKIGEAPEDKSNAKTAPVKVGEAAEGKQGKTPAPVKVGDSSGAKSDTAPVSTGDAAAANKSETAPVKVGEAPPAKSDSAPVTIGDASAANRVDVAPVKVAGASEAKTNSVPVTLGDSAPANRSDVVPVTLENAPPAKSDSAPVTIAGASLANRVDVAPVTMKGEAMAEAEFATVAPSSLRVPMLFKQVGAGEAKVEALLRDGALKPDDLVWAVHHPRLWQEKAEVLTAAASTIEVYDAYLARFGDQVADAVNWEPSARAALAAELSRRGDERCVPLFETATAKWVAQWERGEQRKIEGAVPGLHALAWFYQGKGEQLKAAQTYEKSASYSTASSWVSSALIEAAQIYAQLGEADKAANLYAQVTAYGDGWSSMLVLYAQALPLINAGKLDEAKALLSRPLTMTERATDGLIAQNAWLASLSYQQGDLESALRYGEQMKQVATGKKLTKATTNNLYQMGLDTYNRAGGWKNQPIQTDIQEVVFQFNPSQPERPLYARFRVKTYGDTSITASVDNPNVQARVLPVNNWQREGLNAQEEEMEVIVQSNSLTTYTDVPLVLSSATRGKTTTVRLSLVEKAD